MPNANEVRLDGCNIHRIDRDDEDNIVGAILKFGGFYYPLVGEDAKRLRVTFSIADRNNPLWEFTRDGFIYHYYLNVEGMDFTAEYEDLSKLIGVDWQEVAFTCSVTERSSGQTPYSDARDVCRTTKI